MNCKPGDFAYIVAPYAPPAQGHVVEVTRLANSSECLHGHHFLDFSGAAWVCVGRIPMLDGYTVTAAVIGDEFLRPIRDPGEDAVDESLSWAPVSEQQETAPA